MIEADQSHHIELKQATIRQDGNSYDARKEIKAKINCERRIKLALVPARDIPAAAKAMIAANQGKL